MGVLWAHVGVRLPKWALSAQASLSGLQECSAGVVSRNLSARHECALSCESAS